MREYSSTMDEIEERIETLNYKLAIVNYLIEKISDTDGESDLAGETTINDHNRKERMKEDLILFYKEVNKLLRGNSDIMNTNIKSAQNIGTNNYQDIYINDLKKYLPILSKIKMAQEGEIILLERKKKNYFIDK